MSEAVGAAKSSAPGQYLGFSLQPVRLFFHLITADAGCAVSLEYLDDVAIHWPDGAVLAEQDKSALKQNPVGDFAVDLWKTLHNWLLLLQGGQCKPGDSIFQIYVAPGRSGKLVERMHRVSSDEEAAEFWLYTVKRWKRHRAPPGSSKYLEVLAQASPEERSALFRGMILAGDKDPIDPLRSLLSAAVSPPLLDVIVAAGIGLAKEKADKLLRARSIAMLDADAFKVEFRSLVQRNNLPGLLASLTNPPEHSQVEMVMRTRPVFLQQLEYIDATPEDQIRAVSDFLRSSADRTLWAEAGIIFEQGLSDWNDDLVRRYRFVAGEVQDLYSRHPVEVQGRTVYRRCASLDPPMDGRVVPGHFVHGSFNSLADQKAVGWHPDYVRLLDGNGQTDA